MPQIITPVATNIPDVTVTGPKLAWLSLVVYLHSAILALD